MAVGSLALAFVAGVLSILSPCVLPILPIALGAAASEHRGGPVALAAGLAVSFVIMGLFAATIGYSIGLNAEIFRYVAAVLMNRRWRRAAGAALSGAARACRRAAREPG
jgi:cytochrome c-type biogenesis protein